MNITTMQMYWLVKLDNIIDIIENLESWLVPITIFALMGAITLTLLYFFAGNGDYDIFEGKSNKEFQDIKIKLWKYSGTCIKTGIISAGVAIALGIISNMIPSTKQMAAIMIVPCLVNSEKVQTIGNKVYDLAVEWMEELKPEKESEVK
jgi:hypothetical protein